MQISFVLFNSKLHTTKTKTYKTKMANDDAVVQSQDKSDNNPVLDSFKVTRTASHFYCFLVFIYVDWQQGWDICKQ